MEDNVDVYVVRCFYHELCIVATSAEDAKEIAIKRLKRSQVLLGDGAVEMEVELFRDAALKQMLKTGDKVVRHTVAPTRQVGDKIVDYLSLT